MSTANAKQHEEAHHDLPLLGAFIALLILTIVEVGIGYLPGSTVVTAILMILAVAKAVIVGAVFMEIAYDKDTGKIVLYVFIVPLITVLFLVFAIVADWRVI